MMIEIKISAESTIALAKNLIDVGTLLMGQEVKKLVNGIEPLPPADATLEAADSAQVEEPKKRGRGKAKAAPKVEEEEEDFDLGDEEEEEEQVSALDLPAMLKAFKDFAGAADGNREKAKKVLTKFKVKSVKDLPADKYEAVLKELN